MRFFRKKAEEDAVLGDAGMALASAFVAAGLDAAQAFAEARAVMARYGHQRLTTPTCRVILHEVEAVIARYRARSER